MIEWRLHILMAEKRMRNKDLAEKTGMHPVAVSRLRKAETFPRLDAKSLELLCKALDCQPGDLLRYKDDIN